MSEKPNKNIEAIYQLSPTQEGMLTETLSEPESGLHIEQSVCTLQGELNIEAFKYAWEQVVSRHPALRTAFVWKSQNKPLQAVLKHVEFDLSMEDWTMFPDAHLQEKLDEYLTSDRTAGFNLSKPPVMRLKLFKTGNENFIFIWTSHHILMDGWCIPIVLKEVSAYYNAFLKKEKPEFLEPRPYRDYINWLTQRNIEEAENFWKEKLKGFSKTTPLGLEENFIGNDTKNQRYLSKLIRCTEEETLELQNLLMEQRLTANTVVQGIWSLLLARYSSMDDVVYGITVSGRPPELTGIDSTIGLFINTLPLRIKVDSQIPFISLIQGIQKENLSIREYEYCSSGQIHQWSDVPGIMSLYESVLVFENYPESVTMLKASQLTFNIFNSSTKGAQTKKTLVFLISLEKELVVNLIFDSHRINTSGVENILDHFKSIMAKIIKNPHIHVDELMSSISIQDIPRVQPMMVEKQLKDNYVAPRNAIEKTLSKIWSTVLKYERVGVRDNIFAIGGNSIVASQIVSKVRETYDIKMPLSVPYETPTIAELANYIEEAQKESTIQSNDKEGVRNDN